MCEYYPKYNKHDSGARHNILTIMISSRDYIKNKNKKKRGFGGGGAERNEIK